MHACLFLMSYLTKHGNTTEQENLYDDSSVVDFPSGRKISVSRKYLFVMGSIPNALENPYRQLGVFHLSLSGKKIYAGTF